MKSLILPVLAAVALFACAEDEHEHEAEDFASYDACVEHYTAEGHTADEFDDLCAALEDTSSSSG